MDRLTWRLQHAARALVSFKELANIAVPSVVERDAAIQRFEYTTEACWKAAQADWSNDSASTPRAQKRSYAPRRKIGCSPNPMLA